MRPPGLVTAVVAAVAVAVLAVALLRGGALWGPAEFVGTVYDPPAPAPVYPLTDHRGESVTLEDHRGTALLVFFGFTSCPDVCPLTLQKLNRVLASMRADTTDVRVLLVTVDPERDTPAALAGYVARFGPYATGLTGDSAALAGMRSDFGVYAGPHPGDHVMDITHTTAVFGVDRDGQLRVLLPMEAPDETLAADIRTLMRG